MPRIIKIQKKNRDVVATLCPDSQAAAEIRRRGRARLETQQIMILAKRLERCGLENGLHALIEQAQRLVELILR